MNGTRTYRIWAGLIQRTTNPARLGWQNYGGRGIKVCKRWLKFENFLADMGEQPEGLEIDRDNSKGYSKSNCQWVTKKMNCRNRRSNVHVKFEGVKMTLKEASELSNINYNTLRRRIIRGWKNPFATSRRSND